jgi:CHAD domain-containing protein
MELDYVKLKEIKPALSGYIRESQILLKKFPVPDEEVVHDVRVLMKKGRAVLKLAANQLDSESFSRDLLALRKVGRIMGSWRDTSVHRKTLKEFKKEFPGVFSQIKKNEVITALLKKPDPVIEPCEEIKTSLEQITVILNKTGYRIRFQSMDKFDPQLLIKDLELSYLRVVDTYITCRNSLKSKNLHEFRKKAKDFLYQLYFFRPLNPSVIKNLEKKLEGIAQNLGKYNDLTQLVKALDYKYPGSTNIPAIDELIIKIREAQDMYLSKVWPSAYKIFCPGQKLVNVLGFKLLVI